MAVITVTITESPYQKYDGIPSTVTLDTNIPATIFYTLDGTEPDTTSDVYVTPISLPSEKTVILKVFATDGTDSSSILTETYSADTSQLRYPRDTVTNYTPISNKATYPYGSPAASLDPGAVYGGVGGTIVDNLEEPREADGYDGFGNETRFYNTPKEQFKFVFTETNSIGERGRGIGTLPANVVYIEPQTDNDHPQSSDANSAYFNPKALVIYHNSGEEPFDDGVVRINRPYFSLENVETTRDKALLNVQDGLVPTGSLLRQHYNPRDNTITYYYYDNRTTRWVISTEPFVANQNPINNLYNIVYSSRSPGDKYVYKWAPFKGNKILT